jgi:galactokinase
MSSQDRAAALPIDSVYGADFLEALQHTALSADAVRRYRAQWDAVHRVLDVEGVPREGRRGWIVPGRIEVLGKHTDYAGGRSLVCAAERGVVLVAAPRDDRTLHVVDAVRQGRAIIALDGVRHSGRVKGWALYPHTVARRFVRNFGDTVQGVHCAIASTLPSAAGLSSSSALTVALAVAMGTVGGAAQAAAWDASIHSALDLATFCGAVESGRPWRALAGEAGVGTMGGAQDHTAILCSTANALSMFAWDPPHWEQSVVLPQELVFAIGVSGVVASKSGAAKARYNRAARTVAHMLHTWNQHTGRHDATLYAACSSATNAAQEMRAVIARDVHPEFTERELAARLDQFLAEVHTIIPRSVDAVAQRQWDTLGSLVAQSQAGAEQALGNQVPETTHLVRSARDEGALAASAFGAGFGGSVWALIPRERTEQFLGAWRQQYITAFPHTAPRASWFATRPAPPVLEVVVRARG